MLVTATKYGPSELQAVIRLHRSKDNGLRPLQGLSYEHAVNFNGDASRHVPRVIPAGTRSIVSVKSCAKLAGNVSEDVRRQKSEVS